MKCKNKECGKEFKQHTTLQKYCFQCVIAKSKINVKKVKEKEWKEKKKVLKDKLKRVIDYRNDARKIFQRWIRIRDLGKSCISCDTLLTDIRDYDAGHFYPANNYPQLLFEEKAVNGQCIYCNKHKSGNVLEYRKGIIERYGMNVLLDLEMLADDKTKRILTKEYYIEIAEKYKKLVKEIDK